MIVRDEERVLARCLRSVAGVADELCIVDTGSRDGTPQVAGAFGARVTRTTACNGPDGRIADFSLARNLALDAATGDWVLRIDADEVLAPGSAGRLRQRAAEGRFEAVRLTVRDESIEWLSARFFRRAAGRRFRGPVHEYIDVDGPIGVDRRIVIAHRPDKRDKEGSSERNVRLLRGWAERRPGDARALYYLGNALMATRRYGEAIECYERSLTAGVLPLLRHSAAHSIAACHLLLERPRRALRSALRAMAIDPRHADTRCLLGDAHLLLGEVRAARDWFRSAIACGAPPPDAVLFIDRRHYGAYPRKRLRLCERLLGGRARSASA